MTVETKKKKRTVIFQPLPYPVPESTTGEKEKIVYVVPQRPAMQLPIMPKDPLTMLIMLPFMPLFILMQMLSQMQTPFPQGMMPRRVTRRKEYIRDPKTQRIIEEFEEYELYG